MAWIVRLFGKKPPAPSEEEQAAAAVDLQRIEQGGIPLGAEERLKRVATASTPFFTSDLTAKEYALAQASGLTPLAQVMGSSVVQHGWQSYRWSTYGGGIHEMPYFAEPWNMARSRAFDRLRQEAQFAGADAVIGIETNAGGFVGDRGNIEYVVFGTAVRDLGVGSRGASAPRMCTLSGQEVDKLRRIGAETLDVIGHTSVVAVALDAAGNRLMNSTWTSNQELGAVSQGAQMARHLAMNEVSSQARRVGANDMVISTFNHRVVHHEYERNNYTYHYFVATTHVLGTAVRLGAHEPHPAPMGAPVMSINLGD